MDEPYFTIADVHGNRMKTKYSQLCALDEKDVRVFKFHKFSKPGLLYAGLEQSIQFVRDAKTVKFSANIPEGDGSVKRITTPWTVLPGPFTYVNVNKHKWDPEWRAVLLAYMCSLKRAGIVHIPPEVIRMIWAKLCQLNSKSVYRVFDYRTKRKKIVPRGKRAVRKSLKYIVRKKFIQLNT